MAKQFDAKGFKQELLIVPRGGLGNLFMLAGRIVDKVRAALKTYGCDNRDKIIAAAKSAYFELAKAIDIPLVPALAETQIEQNLWDTWVAPDVGEYRRDRVRPENRVRGITMKRIAYVLLLVLGLLVSYVGLSLVAQEKQPLKTKTADWKSEPAAPVTVAPSAPTGRRDLTLRQRRELGLTVANLVEIAKELKAEGEIDASTSNGEIAASIAVRLAAKNPSGFKDAAAIDLDSIIAFIERLLPLILRLIDLFS